MELPSEYRQRRDIRAWERQMKRIDESEYDANDPAPTKAERFGQAFKRLFIRFEDLRGPAIEYFTPDPSIRSEPPVEPADPEEGDFDHA